MDITAFRVKYPEFASASDDTFIQVFLDAAADRIDSDYWGKYYDQAHGLLAAHLLAIAPNGQFARLQSKDGNTTYNADFEKLRQEVTFADRVFF